MKEKTTAIYWNTWQMLGFKFLFLFLGITSILNWDLEMFFCYSTISKNGFDISYIFKFLVGPFYFLDQHIFHLGYNPKTQDAFPQDNHFGAVFYLSVFLFALIATAVWSIVNRKRKEYNRLLFWFNLYLRYTLAITIIAYGIDKFIPVQMSWPNVAGMLTPYGEQSRFYVLWNFMGVSPGYMMLTGGCEIVAGLLLLSRRTLKAGYIFLLTILVNVVAFNWFYNVPVKMFSLQLLIYNLFLLIPYFKELFQFFFFENSERPERRHFILEKAWAKRSLTGSLVLIPLMLSGFVLFGAINRYAHQEAGKKLEKIYNVITFISKDTLPPLTTDTIRWKRLLFAKNHAVVIGMNDQQDWYKCDTDRMQKTLTFHDNDNKASWKTFHYSYLPNGMLSLAGDWKGQSVKIFMKSMPVDSLPLNKEKIKLLTD